MSADMVRVITISLLYSGIMAYRNDGYGEDHNYDDYSNSDEDDSDSDEDDYSSDEDTDEGGMGSRAAYMLVS